MKLDTNDISMEDMRQAALIIKRFGLNRRKKDVDKLAEEMFYHLCFAILAPQTTFKSNHKAITYLREYDFMNKSLTRKTLETVVKSTRFYRIKADRLLKLKEQFSNIFIMMLSDTDEELKREYLVENVNGIGMKAASHFLRNMGYKNLAIIDTHVLKFLECDAPKNKKEYLKIERRFRDIANKLDLHAAELDAIVWKRYSGTPWEKFTY